MDVCCSGGKGRRSDKECFWFRLVAGVETI